MEKESLNNNIISKVNLDWIKKFKKSRETRNT